MPVPERLRFNSQRISNFSGLPYLLHTAWQLQTASESTITMARAPTRGQGSRGGGRRSTQQGGWPWNSVARRIDYGFPGPTGISRHKARGIRSGHGGRARFQSYGHVNVEIASSIELISERMDGNVVVVSRLSTRRPMARPVVLRNSKKRKKCGH